VFAALVAARQGGVALTQDLDASAWLFTPRSTPTYGELLAEIEDGSLADARTLFERLPLRCVSEGPLLGVIPGEASAAARDPELHVALQDLGNEINEDIREALDALDNPNHYFPGVDDGIVPVSDEHVELVIWGLQRELDRERRSATGFGQPLLPPAPLARLPWNVQRAIAERRRLRYHQWGIDRETWQSGTWSLWAVPAEPEFVPRRTARIAEQQRAAA
jgi:hypothetical protein